MKINCEICGQTTDDSPERKGLNLYARLCPECYFLTRQQNQLAGPERGILTVLREYLMQHKLSLRFVDRKKIQPDDCRPQAPAFIFDSIFGSFPEKKYFVTYLIKASPRQQTASQTAAALCRLFATKDGKALVFHLPGHRHLVFGVDDIKSVLNPDHPLLEAKVQCRITVLAR